MFVQPGTEAWICMTRPEKSLHLLAIILLLVYKCTNPKQGLQSAVAKNIFVATYS